MFTEFLKPHRGTLLRKNGSNAMSITLLPPTQLSDLMMINGERFIPENLSKDDLAVNALDCYMLINNGEKKIELKYSQNIYDHKVIYNPYKYEHTEKQKIDPTQFQKSHDIPEGYIDILPKWYSIKFTYPEYNLIFIKPEMGISFQIHDQRKEFWEIIDGRPIILNNHDVHYFVKSGTHFEIPINTFHTVINPNKKKGEYVVLKERWAGEFDEVDITRVFNPNDYH